MPAAALISPGYAALGPDDAAAYEESDSDDGSLAQHPIIQREARPGLPRDEPTSYTSLSDMPEEPAQPSQPQHPLGTAQDPTPHPTQSLQLEGSTVDPLKSPLHRIASNMPQVSPLSPPSSSPNGNANSRRRLRPGAGVESLSHGPSSQPEHNRTSPSNFYRSFVLNGLDLKRLQNALADANIDLPSQHISASTCISEESCELDADGEDDNFLSTIHNQWGSGSTEFDEDEHYKLVIHNLARDDEGSDHVDDEEYAELAEDLSCAHQRLTAAQMEAADAARREGVTRQRAVKGIRQERRARHKAEEELKRVSKELLRLQAKLAKGAILVADPSDDDMSIFSGTSLQTHESHEGDDRVPSDEDLEDALRWTAAQALAREEVEEQLEQECQARREAELEVERLQKDLSETHRKWGANLAAAQEEARLQRERVEVERKRTRKEAERRIAESRARSVAEEQLRLEKVARIEARNEAHRAMEDLSRIETEWAASRAAAGEEVRNRTEDLAMIERLLKEENQRRAGEEQARMEAEARVRQMQQARLQAESDAHRIAEELEKCQKAWNEQCRGADERMENLQAELDSERRRTETHKAAHRQADDVIRRETTIQREAKLEKVSLVKEIRRAEAELEAQARAKEDACSEVAKLRELLLAEEARRLAVEAEAKRVIELQAKINAELQCTLQKESPGTLQKGILATNPSKIESQELPFFSLQNFAWNIPTTMVSTLIGIRAFPKAQPDEFDSDDHSAEAQEEKEDYSIMSLLQRLQNHRGKVVHLIRGEGDDNGDGSLGIFHPNSIRIAQVCLAAAYFTGLRVGFGFGNDSNNLLGGIGVGGSWGHLRSFSLPFGSFFMR